PQSVLVAFCLGLLFTLATIWLAAWTASRMTIAAAMRDLPEPPPPQPGLAGLVGRALRASARASSGRPRALGARRELAGALVTRGLVPLVIGWWLARRAIGSLNALEFSLGLSCLAVGGVLALRWLALAALAAMLRRRPRGSLFTFARATALADRLST